MNTPERSAAIARALASRDPGLPEDFAVRVAALADRERALRWSWNDAALFAAFVAMVGVCVAGWFSFGAVSIEGAEWWGFIAGAAASYPWLAVGVAGVSIVQMLTYRRRAGM